MNQREYIRVRSRISTDIEERSRMPGQLYLVGTPIGNLNDMSPRALQTLREADLIAAEDTRTSMKLMNHFGINVPMTSYHEYNKIDKAHELVTRLLEGTNIALITDAGMPAVSDPGEELVRMAMDAGITVSVVPGPTAVVSALAISGQRTRRFVFEGFLPADKKEREEVLASLENETRTIILYEAPHRLGKTIELLSRTLGERRNISIVRELTKVHEEVWRTTLAEAAQAYAESDRQARGEYVLVIEGRDPGELLREKQAEWDMMSIREHVRLYEERGDDRKTAMKKVAQERGISKRDVYKECLE